MIRIGLLDTTVPGTLGSMARYRDQLQSSLQEFHSDRVLVSVEYLGCDNETLNRTPARLRMWRRHFHIWKAAKALETAKYDLVHILDGSFGYVAKAMSTNKVIVTLHDVIPRLQMDGFFASAPLIGQGASWIIRKSLDGVRNADFICAVSQNTANDLDRYRCGADVNRRVVPMAIERELFEGPAVSPSAIGLKGRFVFHLGNNGFYKNRIGAIEVFRRMDPNLDGQLVLAGPQPDAALTALSHQNGLSERVVVVENPDQQMLANLYRSASVFLFPSIYEGFGWPPLEAMAAGCPVVTSDAGSLPEVVGDAGFVVPAGDYDAMATACNQLLQDNALRKQTIQRGLSHSATFNTQRLADTMVDIYSQVSSG